MLKFLGNGSGFTNSHTNAYFEMEDKIVLIDISMLNIDKFLSIKPYLKDTYVLLTHLHADHVSGLGMLIQYYYYVYKTKLTVVVPWNLEQDVLKLMKIEGVSDEIFNLRLLVSRYGDKKWEEENNWYIEYIQTVHAPELKDKCYSYLLNIDKKIILYTGDTCTLDPYDGIEFDELYADVSARYGSIHLKFDDIKNKLIDISKKAEVYIMHIDDMDKMKQLVKDTPFHIVEVW